MPKKMPRVAVLVGNATVREVRAKNKAQPWSTNGVDLLTEGEGNIHLYAAKPDGSPDPNRRIGTLSMWNGRVTWTPDLLSASTSRGWTPARCR